MIRHIFSCIICLFLIPLMSTAVLSYNVSSALLKPEFYKTTLQKADAYNGLMQALPSIALQIAKQNKADLGPYQDGVVRLAQKAVSPAWIENNVNLAIDQFLKYIKGEQNTLNFVISLKDIKDSAQKDLPQIVREAYNRLPDCTLAQLAQMQKAARQGAQVDFQCRNQFVSADKVVSDFNKQSKQFFKQIPNEYDVGAMLTQNKSALDMAKFYVAKVRQGVNGLVIASVVLLLILALIHLHHKRAMLAWLSVPILISSLAVFGGAGTKKFVASINMPADFSVEIKTLLIKIAQTGADQIAANMRGYAILALIVGVVLVVAAAVRMRKEVTAT